MAQQNPQNKKYLLDTICNLLVNIVLTILQAYLGNLVVRKQACNPTRDLWRDKDIISSSENPNSLRTKLLYVLNYDLLFFVRLNQFHIQ